jgi:hypothetical protein
MMQLAVDREIHTVLAAQLEAESELASLSHRAGDKRFDRSKRVRDHRSRRGRGADAHGREQLRLSMRAKRTAIERQ